MRGVHWEKTGNLRAIRLDVRFTDLFTGLSCMNPAIAVLISGGYASRFRF
jgi:hypothetical protein